MQSILRLQAVMARTGLSRSAIYAKMAWDEFPHAISLGPRTVGWVESEIDDWLNQQIEASRLGSRK
jgi:prophage regulatory protein